MPKFFCERKAGETLYIEGEDARHISRVLRMKPGEKITRASPLLILHCIRRFRKGISLI